MKKAWIYGGIGLAAVLSVVALVLSGVLTPAPEKSWDGRFVAYPKNYGVRFRNEKATTAPLPPGGVVRVGGSSAGEFTFSDSLEVTGGLPPIDGAPEAPIAPTDSVTFSDGSRLRLLAILTVSGFGFDEASKLAFDASGKALSREDAARLRMNPVSAYAGGGVTMLFESVGGARIGDVVNTDAATGWANPSRGLSSGGRNGDRIQLCLSPCHVGGRAREVDFLAYSGAVDSAPVPVSESRANFPVGPATVATLGSFHDVPTTMTLKCGNSTMWPGLTPARNGSLTFLVFPRGESASRYAVIDTAGKPWADAVNFVARGYFAEGDPAISPVISRTREVKRIRMRIPVPAGVGPSLPEDPLDWPFPPTMNRERVSVGEALAWAELLPPGRSSYHGPRPAVSGSSLQKRRLTEFPRCGTLRELLREAYDEDLRDGWTLRVEPNWRRIELNPPEPSFLSKARVWLKSHAGFLFP